MNEIHHRRPIISAAMLGICAGLPIGTALAGNIDQLVRIVLACGVASAFSVLALLMSGELEG